MSGKPTDVALGDLQRAEHAILAIRQAFYAIGDSSNLEEHHAIARSMLSAHWGVDGAWTRALIITPYQAANLQAALEHIADPDHRSRLNTGDWVYELLGLIRRVNTGKHVQTPNTIRDEGS